MARALTLRPRDITLTLEDTDVGTKREVAEGLLRQGVDEQIAYTITTTNWGSSPTTTSMVVKDETLNFTDVTATVASGSTSVAGDVITLPIIKLLTAGHIYRAEVKFTSGGNVFECYFRIKAEV